MGSVDAYNQRQSPAWQMENTWKMIEAWPRTNGWNQFLISFTIPWKSLCLQVHVQAGAGHGRADGISLSQ